MAHSDKFILGKVLRTSGTNGAIFISLDSDHPEKYAEVKEVWIGPDETLTHYNVSAVEIGKAKSATLLLEGITEFEAAEKLKGSSVWVSNSFLPPLSGNSFYHHEIIGFEVIDKVVGKVGKAKGIVELPHQKLLEIDVNGREVLLPLLGEFYLGISREQREILVSIPDGLLEI